MGENEWKGAEKQHFLLTEGVSRIQMFVHGHW